MSLIRYEPFTAMDELFSRFPSLLGRWPRTSGNGEAHLDWTPPVDISETGQEYLIRAALPAVKKEDVEVTVEAGMLTLSGERRQKRTSRRTRSSTRWKVSTAASRAASRFRTRSMQPRSSAESKDGVLTIHVPKTKVEAKKPTTIKVQ